MSPTRLRPGTHIRVRTRLRAAIAAAAAALAVTSVTAAVPAQGADAAPHARPASVSGSGRIVYDYAPADEIRFTVDARAVPFSRPFPDIPALAHGLPTDARGTVTISHRVAATGQVGHAEAAVDCLATGGPVAALTAVVTESDVLPVGERIGLSVYDSHGKGTDRLGFSWGVVNLDLDTEGRPRPGITGTCMAPAPFNPVVEGGYHVHHTELPTS
ncbi:hypothetical protein PUR71_05320 [Streptomyces sp. SP17BM10]|uniref:hypothetical protein n=1 Tax=Streptomyces sp. SP17BM10 TaxID=3002530 RepID=UPI002E76ED5F|nr:hypothetical protein [Streptomyces sp. SP17BM10]MEE1782350.1 hypothetical protein [Streptomyces sp. SP17BM10]